MSAPKGWTPLPHSLARAGIKIKPAEMRVLTVLASHGLENTWVSHRTIASESGMGVTAVKDNLKRLREKGIIDWTERKRSTGGRTSNNYTILVDMWGGVDRPAKDGVLLAGFRPTPLGGFRPTLKKNNSQEEPPIQDSVGGLS